MTLLGPHAWWMPGWLDRIVRDLQLESGASEHAPEEAPPGGDVVANR
jgi:putative drug exporter of the RND superfamily